MSGVLNLRMAMDDVFGPERCVAQLVWKNKYNAGALTKGFSSVHEYILAYSKGEIANITSPLGEEEIAQYKGRDSKFATRGGFVTQPLATSSKDPRPNLRYPITIGGREIWPEKQWIWARDRVEAAIENDEVVVNETDGKVSVRVKQYLKDENGKMREMKPLSILVGPFNQEGSKESAQLLGDGVFSFPKPVRLLRHLVSLTVNDQSQDDFLVLDFFAGSGTTGHAVMAENGDDGGSRRYILVQLPEPLDSQNKDQKDSIEFCDQIGKPRNIAELTKERLRRAAKRIREEKPLFAGDLGFRVFKLDSSNIRAWGPDPEDLEKSLLDAVEHIKPERTEQDILFELLLKLGLDLCVPIQKKTIARKTVYSVGAGVLLVCLTSKIAPDDVESLAMGIVAWHKEQAPTGESTVVFRDSSFADDVAKTNLTAILQQHGLENVRSL
jgi:adenine-specific DNA-methyltransferase